MAVGDEHLVSISRDRRHMAAALTAHRGLADIYRMPALPLLTSRRHVDLLRVTSASCAGR
ncbi:putative leader peptide [Streptomyces sp. G-5]|uniref:putative leader peptide n=1 Tax=Streptomyces sp. G-5 TaxID=2977231 RepID=UPI003977B2CD